MPSPSDDPLFGNRASELFNAAADAQATANAQDWQPPAPEVLQDKLPAYQVLALIGRGGMGAVYRGVQISLNREVAIKILPPQLLAADPHFAERFKQEAQAMARFSHPNIISVFDFGQMADGTLFFVMEFINGTDVAQMIQQQGRLSSAHAMAIAAHVCDALQCAHEHGVVHRDIKPANIIVGYDGRVKVADFGLAKSRQNANTSLTVTGHVMGTPHYVAPEALMLGVSIDHRADIYAVGVMLYQMLTGKLPQGLFEMPSLKVPGLDPRYDHIIASAMREDRDQRYQRIRDMRRALDAILTQPVQRQESLPPSASPGKVVAGPTQPKPRAASQPRPPQAARPAPVVNKRSGKGGWLIAAAVVLVLGAGLWFQWEQQASAPDSANQDTETSSIPDFAPSSGDTWVDGLAAYWAGDWKDDTLFAREGTNGVRGLKDRAVFWPLDPKTKPMRDVAIRVLWRWPDTKDSIANKPPSEGLAVAFRSSVQSNTGTITDKIFNAGYLAGITVANKDGTSRPSDIMIQCLDSGGKNFGDAARLKQLDRSKRHTFELRAVNNDITFRLDHDASVISGNWAGDYYQRGQATEGLIHGFVPQGVIIDRFEYANLDKPRFPETLPASPDGITKDKPFINSLGMKFVPVPGTKVLMCIHETRKRDYAAFAASDDKVDDAWKSPTDSGLPVSEGDDHPVVAVSSFDAEAFCQWLSKKEGRTYRLPRWMEWSWAVGTGPLEPEGATQEQLKANLAGVYPWGREWPPPNGAGNIADETLKARNPKADIVADYNDGFATTAPAMSFPPNELGIYDLCGNVGEWVLEFTTKGDHRILRGPSFVSPKAWDQLLASVPGNGGQPSGLRIGTIGFRCVIETNESTASVTMAPAKASPPPSIPVKETSDATTERLNQIESLFRAAFDREAEKMVNADFAALDKSLAANGFPQAIADAQRRNASADAAALIRERDRFLATRVMPAEDTPDVHPAVAKLRTKYRDARKAIEAGRKGKPVPPALYEGYLRELTKSSRDSSRLDVAKIKTRYQEIAKAAGFETVPLPANATVEWQSRCGSARREKLVAYGAKPGADAVTGRALEFLATHQNPDGSWGSENRCGVTGLSLLAFLGRCETTESMAYSDVVLKAAMFLIEAGRKNRDGLLSESPASPSAAKEHPIATTALGELYQTGRSGLKTLPGLREVYERAVGLILRNRLHNHTWAGKNGGNGYWERSEPEQPTKDFFTTALNLQALKIALESEIKDKEITGVFESSGVLWNDFRNTTPQSDGTNPDARMAATIFGLLYVTENLRVSIGQGTNAIAESVYETKPQWADADLSAWYFTTLAMTLEGSRKWKVWNETAMPVLIASQSSTGSWQRPRAVFSASEVECTALGALMLESCFRIPPRKK
ncbi:MAG: protein kinase [Verrucomicrobiaceae bacterium]